MEIKRKAYNRLLEWKKTNGSQALLIEGARRIGKSYLAEKFAKEEYESYILIDFNIASKRVKDAFNDLNNLDIFFETLMVEYGKKLFNRKSLIIFDEIQSFPKAREAIKYLVADGRYDYIETGSLISIKENVENITIPSEERKIKMFPVDFEEFVDYMGESILYEYLRECYKASKEPEIEFHKKAMHLFKEYMLVGGMPQAVVAFKENNRDFFAADIKKRNILDLYRDDIKKASKRYNSKVSAIFENIPGYLSTHEKRIVLSEIEKDGRFSRYDDPLFWLDDSMICNLCYKCNDPNVGLALNKNESYVKCYMADTGLLVSLAFSENDLISQNLYNQIMNDKLSLNEGMLYENAIAQMLIAMSKKLYFYTRYNEDKHRNDIEIDFLISNDSSVNFKVVPIEVKSSKNYQNTSLIKFKELFKKRINKSIIVHPKKYQIDNNIIKIPPYMLMMAMENNDIESKKQGISFQ